MDRLRALILLDECTGDDIWPLDYCRAKGIPEDWLDEMADAYESGFQSDRQTIYYEGRVVNQFHGVHDRDLAFKLAEFLGIDTVAATRSAFDRRTEVRALKNAVDEL